MPNDTEVRRGPYADVAPALDEITQNVLFGDVWERPGLSKRDRSLITVATLVALYRANELAFHLKRALENGVTKQELVELITHLAFYAGWPPASTAVGIARQVFADAASRPRLYHATVSRMLERRRAAAAGARRSPDLFRAGRLVGRGRHAPSQPGCSNGRRDGA